MTTVSPDPDGPSGGPGDGKSARRMWADGRVLLDVAGPVATVILADPAHRNAQTPMFWHALAEAGRSLPGTVRVVVLRAEGPSFSAGLDRRLLDPDGVPGEFNPFRLASADGAECDVVLSTYQEAFTWWRRADIITVAAVHGHAVGGGFQLALACDLRVAAEDARFTMRETSLGLVPDLTGTKSLTDLVGYGRAMEICLTGRWIDAPEALGMGLVNAVVARDDLDDAVAALVESLLAAPRNAVVETKALLLGAASRDYDSQRAAERQAQARRIRDLMGVGD